MAYRLKVLAQQAGFRGLFAGLGPRMVMTAGLVSGQFLLYGVIRDGERVLAQAFLQVCWVSLTCPPIVGLGAPPGIEIHKETLKL